MACLGHTATVNVPWQNFGKSRVWEKFHGKVTYTLIFGYPNFLLEQDNGIGRGKPLFQKTRRISSAILTQYWRVIHTHTHTQARSVVAHSRGKNPLTSPSAYAVDYSLWAVRSQIPK